MKKEPIEITAAGLAEILAELRREAGLTQGQAAEKSGLARCTVNRYESLGRIPPADHLVRLLEAYGWRLQAVPRRQALGPRGGRRAR